MLSDSSLELGSADVSRLRTCNVKTSGPPPSSMVHVGAERKLKLRRHGDETTLGPGIPTN